MSAGPGVRADRTRAWWPADTSVALRDEPIGDVLRAVAREVPDRPAVIEAGSPDELLMTSYRELADRAGALAGVLRTEGGPRAAVAVWAPNSTAWVVAEYAVALAGMVLVPLNPAFTDTETRLLVERSGATVVLASRSFRGRDLVDEAEGIARVTPRVRRVADIDRVDELATPESSAAEPNVPVPVGDPFLVQYTSGTTGTPKGAVLTQRAALNVGVLTPPALDLDDGPVWVNPLPMHHVGGSVCVLLSVLAARGTVVLSPDYEPRRILGLLARTRATVLGAVPTMLYALLDHPDRADHDLSALEIVQIGGSTVPSSLIERAEAVLGARIVNAYGQSEAPSACQTRLDDSDDTKAATIGRPGLHREACIRDQATGGTVAFGDTGELCLRSPLTMLRYLDEPERTAEVLDADGWLHTGDLCSMSTDGVVSIHGRLREVIIRGGENIYPAEVEAVLLRHPAVAAAAVVGAPDEHWGEQVAAFVRFTDDARDTSWGALEDHVRGYLAGFKVPRVWRAVDDFPMTAAGKVQKFRLQELLT